MPKTQTKIIKLKIMQSKKTFQCLDLIKNHLPKTRNVLGVFLIAVFCAGSLGVGEARAKALNQ